MYSPPTARIAMKAGQRGSGSQRSFTSFFFPSIFFQPLEMKFFLVIRGSDRSYFAPAWPSQVFLFNLSRYCTKPQIAAEENNARKSSQKPARFLTKGLVFLNSAARQPSLRQRTGVDGLGLLKTSGWYNAVR